MIFNRIASVDETVNHIIKTCSKLTQKEYKIDWVGKIIHSELFKSLKVDYAIVIYEALCFNVTQSWMNGAPNENETHSCRFASQAC